MRQPKLIICDIDNTLTGNGLPLSKRTQETIQKLREKGIYFGIASGRPLDEVMGCAKKWGFDSQFEVVVGMNGCELWDEIHQEQHETYKLKIEWMKEIYERMKPFGGNVYIYFHGALVCKDKDQRMMLSAKKSGKEVYSVENEEELWSEENAKMMFRVEEEKMAEIEKFFEENPSPYYKAFKTQTTLIEFADKRISKAVALEKFCENNQISLEDVVAFGDMSNDKEMLEAAGWGVCLLNGSDDMKAIADDITDLVCDEDGFADYCEKHYLCE